MKNSLTIVIPLYNESAVVSALFKNLNKIKRDLPQKTDFIFVNDGSNDDTEKKLISTKINYPKSVITFSRNFGHQAALFAGLEASKGDVVITMDADLQHPPSLITKMLSLHKRGYHIVLTHRVDTEEVSFFKRITSQLFYKMINSISETQILLNASDFRLMSREAVNTLLAMPEKRKFLRGMVNWIGYESIILPFTVQKRVAGESKYSFAKMMKLAFHGITSFSTVPLYFAGFFSLLFFSLAFFYALYVIYIRLFLGAVVSGWASVLFVLLVIGAFISLFLGLTGVYLAAIYDEVKSRPNYIINRIKK